MTVRSGLGAGGGQRAETLGSPAQTAAPLPGRQGSPALAMEILDEFDSEVPQSETFCQQISEEDLERQVDTTLSARCTLDRNPSLAERVVQLEQRGLLSFLWVRPRGLGPTGWELSLPGSAVP